MRSIAWLSEKGGSGKSTCCINVAVGLAKLGKRVLVIDADPQGSATLVFLKGKEPEGQNLYHVLTEGVDAGDTVVKTATAGLDLLPADTRLADANLELVSQLGRERRLLLAMRGLDEGYDFVMIDTSPQRTLVNINVLNYVSEVFCPIDPGVFSLAGIAKLQGAVAEVVGRLDNQALKIAGLVVARTQPDNLSRDVESRLRATFDSLVLKTTIPASTKIGEAHARFLSVLDYAPRSAGAKAYEALTRELIKHGKANRSRGRGDNPSVRFDSAEGRTGRTGKRAAG